MPFSKHTSIESFDPALFSAISHEKQRQEDHVELIASENYVSPCVLEAQGSVLTNKYAEGYPGARYYGGCQYVDEAEKLAIERAKALFGADWANVQPHSGSQANAAVFMALIKPGDTLLGMGLSEGGHLTHGAKPNFSGQLYHSVSYGLDLKTERVDYEQVRDLAKKHRPQIIVAGFSAYSRIMDWKIFREIADEVGAYLLVDMAHVAGLVATGLYPNPIEHAHVVTSTTHKTLRGPRGGLILSKNQPEISKKINSMIFPGIQGGPLMHVIAAKAVAFQEALLPEFKDYQAQVVRNAQCMAEVLQKRGFHIVSGGTDNHLFLLSLMKQNLTGKAAEALLDKAHITVNKNSIPGDTTSPFITSGLRIGSPAVTTRGFREAECAQLAEWIADLLEGMQQGRDESEAVRKNVLSLCKRFPVYK